MLFLITFVVKEHLTLRVVGLSGASRVRDSIDAFESATHTLLRRFRGSKHGTVSLYIVRCLSKGFNRCNFLNGFRDVGLGCL
jgi:hypothetical protein